MEEKCKWRGRINGGGGKWRERRNGGKGEMEGKEKWVSKESSEKGGEG